MCSGAEGVECESGADYVPLTDDTDDTSLGSSEDCLCAHHYSGCEVDPDSCSTVRANCACVCAWAGVWLLYEPAVSGYASYETWSSKLCVEAWMT